MTRTSGSDQPRTAALRFVLLIGVVSMFSDMAHEGARSISGPYLGTLGAGAAVIVGIAGFGELLGYALRFVFGYAADRSGQYWPITLVGYTVQMAPVPLLAFAGIWPVAAVLIIAERTGRAVRNPARDAMLAHATGELGRGWVFGVREALDAAGAMIGPLLVAAVLYVRGGYRAGFAILAVPALLTLAVLLGAWRQYPRPADLEIREGIPERRGIPRIFWIYLLAMGLIGLAYADYPLIAYHFGSAHVLSTDLFPILYAVAMATEAVGALALGRLFDRIGLATVAAATVLTASFAPLVFLGNATLAVAGVIAWGLGMAAQESVVKAAITGMVGADRRASAYGLFDTGFGLFWFLGSVALGLLYDRSILILVVFSFVLQLAAIPLLLWTRRRMPPNPRHSNQPSPRPERSDLPLDAVDCHFRPMRLGQIAGQIPADSLYQADQELGGRVAQRRKRGRGYGGSPASGGTTPLQRWQTGGVSRGIGDLPSRDEALLC